MDVYDHEMAEDEIIKNPKRNKFVLKVYECLFCKRVSENFKTYNCIK